MILLDPKNHDRSYPDSRSTEIMRKTIEFFEGKGKAKLLKDYYDRPWYADFLDFQIDRRIEIAVRDGNYYFSAHDLSFKMGVSVIFPSTIMHIFADWLMRCQFLQPFRT